MASPRSLNDPFESGFEFEVLDSLPKMEQLKIIFKNKNIDITKITTANFYDYLKELLNEILENEYGITCFSETNDNILMWSHYSKSHSGICLQFDSKKLCNRFIKQDLGLKLEKIITVKSIPKVKILIDEQGLSFKDEEDISLCKLTKWRYEKEIRLHGYLSNYSVNNVIKRTIPFERSSLTGIILGEKISKADEDLLAHLVNNHKELKHVKWYRAQKDFTKAKIKIKPFGGFLKPVEIEFNQ